MKSFETGAYSDAPIELVAGATRATISPLAASLRELKYGGFHLVEPTLEKGPAPLGAGLTLAPWPNRIAGAQWILNGQVQQLDITEVSRGHAIHGLLRNAGYLVTDGAEDWVRLEARIWPQHGYPFQLRHIVDYCVSADPLKALNVHQMIVNEGSSNAQSAPVALGAHPYLRCGDAAISELTLTVPGGEFLVANEAMIPTETKPVAGQNDLRQGARLSELTMDQAFTDLTRDENDQACVSLNDVHGNTVKLLLGDTCRFVHIFVTEDFPERARAVAVEPMSAPANSFNSSEGLVWLNAGEEFGIDWGIGAELAS